MKTNIKRVSKLMSLILRHQPDVIGVKLDENGWLGVDELIQGINRKGINFDFEQLQVVVDQNDKKRFTFNDDHTKIRANQGHSVKVDVELKASTPPDILFHGTVERFMDSIREMGLIPKSRLHVHLSADLETAQKVGGRRGKPVILKIDTKSMVENGHVFYRSKNGVWLTDQVPANFIK
ncbi:MAG: RNA 2'-phosphotransferase [Flavobacteriales bacterium]|nr:RNA 2'-phosphotransferase [Flavobacteriales bacterium]